VKIHCVECDKDFGGNTGEHNTHSISNMFANFRKHHLHTNFHIRSLCLEVACRILICTGGSSEPRLTVNKVSTICFSTSLPAPLVASGNPLLLGLRFCIGIRPSLD
jgi:hypothetical protein